MARDISNTDNILDSRDVIARFDEMESERNDLESEIETAQDALDEYDANEGNEKELLELEDNLAEARKNLAEWDDENGQEFKDLKAFCEECEECSSDWTHGESIIHESHWEEYVEDLCKDCGYISKDFPHWIEIDWSKTAKNVAQDYSTVDWAGETYYIRNN